jgi:hypothetical protein
MVSKNRNSIFAFVHRVQPVIQGCNKYNKHNIKILYSVNKKSGNGRIGIAQTIKYDLIIWRGL